MSRVSLNKKIFEWAIERCGLSISDIEEKFPQIHEWLKGQAQPTLKQLEKLAKATVLPIGVYFLKDPPSLELPIPHFRTIKGVNPKKPSPELVDLVHVMQTRQSWLREFLAEDGEEPKAFVGKLAQNGDPIRSAQMIRTALGLKAGWAADVQTWEDALTQLKESIEALGIFVFASGIVGNNTRRKLLVDEFRGFVLVDEYAPLVFINATDSKSAQMFTLAHEIAHVFLGVSAAFDLRELHAADDPLEKACDRIAAELLVPAQELRNFWMSLSISNRVRTVSKNFKVSPIVAARRCLDTGLITKKEFYEFYSVYLKDLKKGKSKSTGGDFYATQGQRVGKLFSEYVIKAVGEGRLLYGDAYRLTGLYGQTFDKFAASYSREE